MANFGSEVQSFLEQKRERNRRLALENRQKIASVAAQLAEREKQKIGFKQAAEQINRLGTETLGYEWKPVTWGQVATSGSDLFVQDINLRKRKAELQELGADMTETVGSEERNIGTARATARYQKGEELKSEKDKLNNFFISSYSDVLSTPEGQEIIERLETVPMEEMAEFKRNATIELEEVKEREDFREFAEKNLLSNPDLNKFYESPQKDTAKALKGAYYKAVGQYNLEQSNIKSALAVLKEDEKQYQATQKVIAELNKSPEAVLVLGAMSGIDQYKPMFDEKGLLKSIDLETANFIRRMATEIKNEDEGLADKMKIAQNEVEEINTQMGSILDTLRNKTVRIALNSIIDGNYSIDEETGRVYNLLENGKEIELKRKEREQIKSYYDEGIKELSEQYRQANDNLADANSEFAVKAQERMQNEGLPADIFEQLGGQGIANVEDFTPQEMVNVGKMAGGLQQPTVDTSPATVKLEDLRVPDKPKSTFPEGSSVVPLTQIVEEGAVTYLPPTRKEIKEVKERTKKEKEYKTKIEKVKQEIKTGKIPTIYHKANSPNRFKVLPKHQMNVIVDTFTNEVYENYEELRKAGVDLTKEQLTKLGVK